MDVAALVRDYGYLALVVGTFFEGEVMLSLGGWAARGGFLTLGWVIVAGAAGTIASDQTCFWAGRLFGSRILSRRPRLKGGVDRVLRSFERYQDWLVMGFQFVPGSCTIVPFSLGLSAMRSVRFAALDLASAAFWSLAYSLGGYVFGAAMQVFIKDLHHFDAWILGGVVLLVVLATYGRRRLIRPPAPSPAAETLSEQG